MFPFTLTRFTLPGWRDWLRRRAIRVEQLSARARREIHHHEGSCQSWALDKWAECVSVCACCVPAYVCVLRVRACFVATQCYFFGENTRINTLLRPVFQIEGKGDSFFLSPPLAKPRRAEQGTGGEWRCVSSPRALWMRCVHGVPSAALWWLKVARRGYLRQAPVCVTMIEREESLGSHLPKHVNPIKTWLPPEGTLISKVQCRINTVDPSIFYCNILYNFGAFIGALIN